MRQPVKRGADAPSGTHEESSEDGARLYAVPALEKSIDVLEFLAMRQTPATLTEISQKLGRAPGELFRILSVLQRREWISRLAGDRYQLSTRLFELASGFPPGKHLVDVALPIMRLLSLELRQSSHLSIPDEGEQLVILDVEAPGPAGLFVRTGTRFPLAGTASGRVMLAFGGAASDGAPRRPSPEGAERKPPSDLQRRLALIRKQGFEECAGEWLSGVIDICWPVFGSGGELAAVLAVPFLAVTPLHQDADAARERIRAAAEDITKAIGGGDHRRRLADAAGLN